MNHFDDTLLALMAEATHYHEVGKWPEAMALYRRILDVNPRNPIILHALGLLYLEFENDDAALQHIDDAIAIDPKSALFYRSYGTALLKKKRFDEAIGAYQISLYLDPKNTDTLENLAKLYQDKDDILSAIAHYKEMTAYPHLASKAHFCLAECFYKMGFFDDALNHYAEVYAAMPFSLHVTLRYTELLLQTRAFDNCLAVVKHGLAYYPRSSQLHHHKAKALFHQNDYESALQAMEQALHLSDQDPSLYYDYAQCLQGLGDH
ncbi:MAG: tetratricopeptide repeat protein, partial [Alphaproteobacteria bacterium]